MITKLTELRNLLINQLLDYGLSGLNNLTFDQLINKIEEIRTTTTDDVENIRPTEKPILDDTDIATFHFTLFKRIQYYIKLLKYFLILKGVDESKVKRANTLKSLILLIQYMNFVKESSFSITPLSTDQYYGTPIPINYTLTDKDGKTIREGEITVKDQNGVIYDSITAGESLSIMPLDTGIYTYTIKYHGSDNFDEFEDIIIENIHVHSPKVKLMLNMRVISEGKYYNAEHMGFEKDTWEIKVTTLNYNNEPIPNAPFILQLPNQTIEELTNQSGTYSTNQVINQFGNHIITCTTDYESDELFSNAEIQYAITIMHSILYQEYEQYEHYLGEHQYKTILRDEISGLKTNRYDGQKIQVKIGDENYNVTITNGEAIFNYRLTSSQEYMIKWTLEIPNAFTESIKTYINALSNFEIPINESYFLNDVPEIYYKPNGVMRDGLEVNAIINGTGTILTTNSNGKLIELSNYTTPDNYTLQLTGNNETKIFNYTLKKPFIIELQDYKQQSYADYKIIVYDKEHFNIQNFNDYITHLIYTNQYVNVPDVVYTYTYTETSESYIITLHIPATSDNIGNNKIIFNINGYTQEKEIIFYDKIFSLATSTVDLGYNTIQINSAIPVNNIEIESNDIEVYDIEKNNNTFTINAVFKKAGNITFTTTDRNNISDNLTINVNKKDIISNVEVDIEIKNSQNTIDNIEYDNRDNVYGVFDINEEIYSDLNIAFILDNTTIKTFTYHTDKTSNNFELKLPTLTIGEHIVKFILNNDNNYQNFEKTITINISQKEPTITINKQYSAYYDIG